MHFDFCTKDGVLGAEGDTFEAAWRDAVWAHLSDGGTARLPMRLPLPRHRMRQYAARLCDVHSHPNTILVGGWRRRLARARDSR